MQAIAECIREMRKQGLNYQDIANKCGASPRTVERWARGKSEPQATSAIALFSSCGWWIGPDGEIRRDRKLLAQVVEVDRLREEKEKLQITLDTFIDLMRRTKSEDRPHGEQLLPGDSPVPEKEVEDALEEMDDYVTITKQKLSDGTVEEEDEEARGSRGA